MTTDATSLWARADEVLDVLLDLPAQARADALQRMGLEAELHAAVRRLLAAHDAADGVLDQRSAARLAPAADLSGTCIGRWQLQREIGRGGMSVVYRAVSTDGAGQVAALKLLTLGARAAHGETMFRQEQAVLARLRHPHLASLFESGIADDGTPWLAMALVEGERIDAWCHARQADLSVRVGLWLQVCDAVAYAHRSLVIHRDIKPSNVLVDGDGLVRLLDFGIARLIDAAVSSENTLGALTPDYASPEQFAGAPPSVAMDVYGLGGLLHQLLTGHAPRSARTEAVEELVPPSRRVEDRALAARIRGDLDAIVLKALAHDPAQRYDTVPALVEDVRRWMAHLPVQARRPTRRYRLARFLRRHRAALAMGTLAVAALLAGLAGALWQARRAQASAEQARIAQAAAESELERATALRTFLTGLFAASAPDRPSQKVSDVAELLELGARRVREDTAMAAPVRADILTTIGRMHYLRAENDAAVQVLDTAIGIARSAGDSAVRELAGALNWRGLVRTAAPESDLGEAPFEEAEALLARHAPQSRLRLSVVQNRAWWMHRHFHSERAIALLTPVLAHQWGGASPDADMRAALLISLAASQTRLGRHVEAKRSYDEILALERGSGEQDSRGYAIALVNSAGTDARLGYFEESGAKLDQAMRIYDTLFGSQSSQYRASARLKRARLLAQQGRVDAALDEAAASNREWAAVVGTAYENYRYTHAEAGAILAQALRFEPAHAALERYLALAPEEKADPGGGRALTLAWLASARCETGAADEGEAALALARASAGRGAYDPGESARVMHEAELRCARVRGDPSAAQRAAAALATADQALLPGDAGEFARHVLLRADLLERSARASEAAALRRDALARLREVGLPEHPLASRLQAGGH